MCHTARDMATLTCTALLDLPRRLWLHRDSRRGRSRSLRTAHDVSKRKAVLRSQQPTRFKADAHLQRRWPTSGQAWRRAVTERARRCTFTAKVRFATRRSPCCSFSFTCEHHDNTPEHATALAHTVSLRCRHHAVQGRRVRRSPARKTRCHTRRQRRSPAAGSCSPSLGSAVFGFWFAGVVSAALVLLALRALLCVALRCSALPCVRFVCSGRDELIVYQKSRTRNSRERGREVSFGVCV